MSEIGAIVYRGPSLLTGDPVLGILTGLEGGTANPKTGPMVQAWVVRADQPPMDAKRQNLDDAVCGDCKLRGRDGKDSGCYVAPWLGPTNVWKAAVAGKYLEVGWSDAQALVQGRMVRLCAYGDPAALPFEVWRTLLHVSVGWAGYTHAWKTCDQRLRAIAMASVDTADEAWDAKGQGWRTFRIRLPEQPLLERFTVAVNRHVPIEFVCPASDEAGFRTTCAKCQLCRGTSVAARSVAIYAHGKPSSLKAFGIDVRRVGRPAKND